MANFTFGPPYRETYQIARDFRTHQQSTKYITWTVENLRIWIAEHVTKESAWYSPDILPLPRFINIANRVLAFYRRHGWSVYRGSWYEWVKDKRCTSKATEESIKLAMMEQSWDAAIKAVKEFGETWKSLTEK